jgi:hypothetical protein
LRARLRPEEALLGLYAVAIVAIMATTGHWTFTNTMHHYFLATFSARARRKERTNTSSASAEKVARE